MNYRVARKIVKRLDAPEAAGFGCLGYTREQVMQAYRICGIVPPARLWHAKTTERSLRGDRQPKVRLTHLKADAKPIRGMAKYVGMVDEVGGWHTPNHNIDLLELPPQRNPVNAPPDAPATSLAEQTLPDLKALAKSMGLKGFSTLKKADLIALIEGKPAQE